MGRWTRRQLIRMREEQGREVRAILESHPVDKLASTDEFDTHGYPLPSESVIARMEPIIGFTQTCVELLERRGAHYLAMLYRRYVDLLRYLAGEDPLGLGPRRGDDEQNAEHDAWVASLPADLTEWREHRWIFTSQELPASLWTVLSRDYAIRADQVRRYIRQAESMMADMMLKRV
jgi:hypothetical protein